MLCSTSQRGVFSVGYTAMTARNVTSAGTGAGSVLCWASTATFSVLLQSCSTAINKSTKKANEVSARLGMCHIADIIVILLKFSIRMANSISELS